MMAIESSGTGNDKKITYTQHAETRMAERGIIELFVIHDITTT